MVTVNNTFITDYCWLRGCIISQGPPFAGRYYAQMMPYAVSDAMMQRERPLCLRVMRCHYITQLRECDARRFA